VNGASRSRKNLFPAHDSIDVSSHLPTQTIAITLLSIRQRVQFPLVVSINQRIQDATFQSSLLLLGDDRVPNIRPHGCNAPHAGRSRRLYDARIIIMRGQRIHVIDARLSRNDALCTYTGALVNQMAAQVMNGTGSGRRTLQGHTSDVSTVLGVALMCSRRSGVSMSG
jgi:hypothetical protein